MVNIKSNGSKWFGDQPDSIDVLIDRLGNYALDPAFEKFGNFISPARGAVACGRVNNKTVYRDAGPMYPEAPSAVSFFGNFAELSAVFNIDTDEPELIERLTKAIRANQASPAYLAMAQGVAA